MGVKRSPLALLVRAVVSLAVGIFLFATVQFVLAIFPLKFHSNITPLHLKLPYDDVRFRTTDGLTLRGWSIPSSRRPKGTILVTHGYPADKGDLLPLAQFLHPRYNLFLFDFRSFGQSEGSVADSSFADRERMVEAVYGSLPGVTKTPIVWLIRSYASLLGVDIGTIDPRRAIAKAQVPILIIHGAGDRQIAVG